MNNIGVIGGADGTTHKDKYRIIFGFNVKSMKNDTKRGDFLPPLL